MPKPTITSIILGIIIAQIVNLTISYIYETGKKEGYKTRKREERKETKEYRGN